MSIDATRWAWQQDLPATKKLVLLSLSDRADERHTCFPSIHRLVIDTGLDKKTVLAAIQYLESKEILSVNRDGGSSNRYQLVGVQDRLTSTKNGTSTEIGTSTKNGTKLVPKTVPNQYQKRDTNLSIIYQEPKDSEFGVSDLVADGVKEDIAKDYLKHRKIKKAPLTLRAWIGLRREITKAGFTLNDGLDYAMAQGWQGFSASWIKSNPVQAASIFSGAL